VLGFTNDMARHIRYAVALSGGLSHCAIDSLNHRLRRTPYGRGGHAYPIGLVTQRVDAGA
jgi:hypothetical protein